MTTLTRRYRFCASHRLHSEQLSAAENERTFGKCNNPYGHGHDYVLEVSVLGPIDEKTGLLISVPELDACVAREIICEFHYRNLNADVPEFSNLVPTTENVALVIADRLSARWFNYFPDATAWLSSISIQETDRNSFQVFLPKESLRSQRSRIELLESVSLNA